MLYLSPVEGMKLAKRIFQMRLGYSLILNKIIPSKAVEKRGNFISLFLAQRIKIDFFYQHFLFMNYKMY
jgi:hypothetical protein